MTKRRWKLAFGIIVTAWAANYLDSISKNWGLFGWEYWLLTFGYAVFTAGMVWQIIDFVRGKEPTPNEEPPQGDMYGR